MDKSVLQEYVDACELVREAEADLKKLQRRRRLAQDAVKGSMHEFPYTARSIHMEGSMEEPKDRGLELEEEKLLEARRAAAEKTKQQVEQWMLRIPVRSQRIVRFKFIEKMRWEEVAIRMGEGKTGDAYRKELNAVIKEN